MPVILILPFTVNCSLGGPLSCLRLPAGIFFQLHPLLLAENFSVDRSFEHARASKDHDRSSIKNLQSRL